MEDKYLNNPFGESSGDEPQDGESSRGKEPETKSDAPVDGAQGSAKAFDREEDSSAYLNDAGEGPEDFFNATTTTSTTTTSSSSQPSTLAKQLAENPNPSAWQKGAKPASGLSGSLGGRSGSTLGSSRSATSEATSSNHAKGSGTGSDKSTADSIDKEEAARNRLETLQRREAANKDYAEVWPRFFEAFNNQAKLVLLKEKLDQLAGSAQAGALTQGAFTPVLDEYVVVCELNRIKALRSLAIDPKWIAALVLKLAQPLHDCRLAIKKAAEVRVQEFRKIPAKPNNRWNPARVEGNYETAVFKARSFLTSLVYLEAGLEFFPECIEQCAVFGEAEIVKVTDFSKLAMSASFQKEPGIVMHWCQLYMASKRVEWNIIFQASMTWDLAQLGRSSASPVHEIRRQ